MVGPSSTLRESKGKQLAISSEESDVDRSSALKDILVKPEGVYRHTRTRIGTIAPVNYNLLAKRIEVNDEHSAIVNPSLQILVRRQQPLLIYQALLKKGPGNLKNIPEFKGNNSI